MSHDRATYLEQVLEQVTWDLEKAMKLPHPHTRIGMTLADIRKVLRGEDPEAEPTAAESEDCGDLWEHRREEAV